MYIWFGFYPKIILSSAQASKQSFNLVYKPIIVFLDLEKSKLLLLHDPF